jgi:prepilin-type N-terminal cleavage/methylation domain-containing protein
MMHSITKQKGFTLVETLVAISILMLAILGPLSIASAGLRNSLYARDQITAFYLAQEGIEYVRYERDDTYLQGADDGSDPYGWLGEDLVNKCFTDDLGDHGCVIDSYEWIIGDEDVDDVVMTCAPENADGEQCPNRNLYLTQDGYYTYNAQSNSSLSHYQRIVKIEPVKAGTDVKTDEVKIVSTMIWSTPSGKRTFELTENLFNIYKN